MINNQYKLHFLKNFVFATSTAFLLNNAAIAQKEDSGLGNKIETKTKILLNAREDTLRINKKFDYAKKLLDLEKGAGFDVKESDYKIFETFINEAKEQINSKGISEDSSKTSPFFNLESINQTIREQNYIYSSDKNLLFHEALKTKKLNSFHYLVFYLEIASQQNFPFVPIKVGEHFFLRRYLNNSEYLNLETISGTSQEDKFYENHIKKTFKEIKEINEEVFFARECKVIGLVLNENKKYNEAIAYFDKSMIANMTDPETHKSQGDSWFAVGNYEKAIDDYDMASNLNEKFTQAYIGSGDACYKLGRLEKAIENYDKAILLDPENFEVYKKRGDMFSMKKNSKNAEKDYEKALELILKK
ncbi:MAG: tetratricopeptide repeat protein [Nanoarchaeota archaeon]